MSYRVTAAKLLTRQPDNLGFSMNQVLAHRRRPFIANWRSRTNNRGQSRCVAPEMEPGPGAGRVFRLIPITKAPQNHVVPWQLTSGNAVNITTAPIAANTEVVLIDTVVPDGFTAVFNAHNQYLEDGAGVAAEEGLIWRLRIGGKDILNPFPSLNLTANPNNPGYLKTGRLIRSNNVPPIPFGPTRDDLPSAPAGTRIQYAVMSTANPDQGANAIAATIYMTLWGDKGT